MRLAIDTGGTFTDCVYLQDGALRVLKIASTPADPSLAVLHAVTALSVNAEGFALDLRHGTTVGTNALLERKGARVAFVTTTGFEDHIAIGRQTRARLYDWFAPVPVCIVPPELRFGIAERLSAEGVILLAPSEQDLTALRDQIRSRNAESIAVSLLFSFANPQTEQRIHEALSPLDLPISLSHRILPEFREYERSATTVINAYLAPRMQQYLLNLLERVTQLQPAARVSVMQSSGGIVPLHLAAQEPVRTLLSGPAGGVIGATEIARRAGFPRIIGFDMGGTSTDVFLADAEGGGLHQTRQSLIGGIPVSLPMLDIHTVGAGGGSIARFDAGGMLRVGPESAGSVPGPICFGHGIAPTVTDANLLLGRLDLSTFLGGGLRIDLERTRNLMTQQEGLLASLESFAAGIVRVIEAEMEKAIRVISIERGYDPREFTLVAFGGGGPLHACALAAALRIPKVLIPRMPGALSAMGILLADTVRDYSQTVMLPGHEISNLYSIFTALEQRATADFADQGLQGSTQQSVDIRYRGQAYELNVPFAPGQPLDSVQIFHSLHQQRYGFADPGRPLQIVNVRLRMTAPGEPWEPGITEPIPGHGSAAILGTREVFFTDRFLSTTIYHRERLHPGDRLNGPALITEYTSATLLPPDCIAEVDSLANLVIQLPQESA